MLTNIWNVFIQSPLWMKVVIVAAMSIGIIWEFSQMFSIGSTTKNVLLKAVHKAGSMQNLDSAVERFMRSEGYELVMNGKLRTFVNSEGKTLTDGEAIVWFAED